MIAGALLLAFWDSVFLWPLKITVVLFHELGHAVAAWATGGSVVDISLAPNQGGLTRTVGGWRFLVLNAGYLGSLLAGVGLLLATRRPTVARGVAYALGITFAIVAVGFVRPVVSFGFGFTWVAALTLLLLAAKAPVEATRVALRGLGVFSVLYALFDVRDDVFRGTGTSDATMLGTLTGVPAVVWGAAWIVAGVATLWVMRKRIT